jgi:hypothetical protein
MDMSIQGIFIMLGSFYKLPVDDKPVGSEFFSFMFFIMKEKMNII